MKKSRIFWGLLLLICAILLIVNKLGFMGDYSINQIVLGGLCLGLLVSGIGERSFGGILFPIAFLAIIFAEQLHITELTPWTVLLVAALGTGGLHLIFGHRKYNRWRNHIDYNKKKFTDHIHSDGANMEVNFSSSVKYINAATFTRGRVECNMGSCEVYFENVSDYKGNATLVVEAAFGKIHVFVPHGWIVVDDVQNNFGSFQMKNYRSPDAGPVLNLRGSANFGAVEVTIV